MRLRVANIIYIPTGKKMSFLFNLVLRWRCIQSLFASHNHIVKVITPQTTSGEKRTVCWCMWHYCNVDISRLQLRTESDKRGHRLAGWLWPELCRSISHNHLKLMIKNAYCYHSGQGTTVGFVLSEITCWFVGHTRGNLLVHNHSWVGDNVILKMPGDFNQVWGVIQITY